MKNSIFSTKFRLLNYHVWRSILPQASGISKWSWENFLKSYLFCFSIFISSFEIIHLFPISNFSKNQIKTNFDRKMHISLKSDCKFGFYTIELLYMALLFLNWIDYWKVTSAAISASCFKLPVWKFSCPQGAFLSHKLYIKR